MVEEEPEVASQDPFSVDASIDVMPSLKPGAAAAAASASAAASPQRDASRSAPQEASDRSAPPQAADSSGAGAKAQAPPQAEAEDRADSSHLGADEEHSETQQGVVTGPLPAVPQSTSPTVSSPRSHRSSSSSSSVASAGRRQQPEGETSLGPLPRSGLDDEEDEDGLGLQYKAVYEQASGSDAGAEAADGAGEGVEERENAQEDRDIHASLEAAPEVEEEEGVASGGLLDQLRAFAASDEEEYEAGGLSRKLSASSLKPAFQVCWWGQA